MAVNDDTNGNGDICGNVIGMCCNRTSMKQRDVMQRTQEAYGIQTSIYTSMSSRENGTDSTNRTHLNLQLESNY